MTAAGLPPLLFGYHMPVQTFRNVPAEDLFERIAANALAAEAAGFDLVTVMDHFYQIRGPEAEPMLEGYVTLAALAARTSRVRLGMMVGGVTYRNPALLAKIVTSLDVVSKGRAVLGLGAAWNESEHTGYGFRFPPIGERMDRLDEALQICRLMFTEERPSFEGRHYRIERALNVPRPIQPGGPPIVVGGSGERRTLRIVAERADVSNWHGPIDELKHKIEVLERHCADVGRDPATILRTVSVSIIVVREMRDAAAILSQLPPERREQTLAATPEGAAALLQPYLDLGFRGIIFRNPGMATPEAVARLGEVVHLLRASSSAAS